MFSGSCIQSTASWAKSLRRDGRPIFFHALFLFRNLWTAHVNDRKRNDRIRKIIHTRILHLQVGPEKDSNSSFPAVYSKPDRPTVLPPCPQAQDHRPPPLFANSSRKSFDIGPLETPEEDKSAGSATLFLPGSSSHDESVLQRAAKPQKPEKFGYWERQREKARSIQREIHDKGSWSHDWRIPLNLLKVHYRATNGGTEDYGGFIAEARKKTDALADAIIEPEEWTKATFDRYVLDLTRFKPPTPTVSRAFGFKRDLKGPLTIIQIGRTLYGLFQRRELQQFFEPRICNAAINFLTRHAMLTQARSIFFIMEHLSIDISFSTVNIFLHAAAHQKDLHTFTSILSTMVKRDIHPDAETWLMFLQCLDSIAAKRFVITKMAELGILDKSGITKRVVGIIVEDDVIEFLASKREPRDLLYRMRLNHGPEWMSSRTGNIILNEVSNRVSLSAGLDLIEPMKQHGFELNAITFKTLFFLALNGYYSPITLATHVLDTFIERQYYYLLDRDVWEHLFLHAWKRNLLHVARVVWVAACLSGNITFDMEKKVLYSLRLRDHEQQQQQQQHQNQHQSPANDHIVPPPPTTTPIIKTYPHPPRIPSPRNSLFRSLFGRFVLGLDPDKSIPWHEIQRCLWDNILSAKTAQLRFSLSFHLSEALQVDLESRKDLYEKGLYEKIKRPYPLLLVTIPYNALRKDAVPDDVVPHDVVPHDVVPPTVVRKVVPPNVVRKVVPHTVIPQNIVRKVVLPNVVRKIVPDTVVRKVVPGSA